MGETAAETLREIEVTRAALDRDLSVLEARLPDAEQMKDQAKVVGGAAAGGIALLTVAGIARSRRKRERDLRREAHRQAEALASYYPDAFAGVAERRDDRSRRPMAALLGLAAGAAVGFAAFRRDDVQAKADELVARARARTAGPAR